MKRFLLVTSFFTLITLIITWPLIFHPTTLIIDRFDGLLLTWYLNWDIHAVSAGFHNFHDWVHFFDANIFYPYARTLAFSDYMLPQALLAFPFVSIFKEPLLAYNVNFLLGFILTGVSLYYLTLFLTKDTKVSISIATLFTFSTVHLSYMPHLQLFNVWPIVLAILYLLKKNYKIYALCLVLASLTTALNLYFLLLVSSVAFLLQLNSRIRLILATLVSAVVLIPFLLPYYQVSREFAYVRPITDAIHFSLQFGDLANISNLNRLSTLLGVSAKRTPAYPGVTFGLLLGVLAVVAYRRIKNSKFFNFSNSSAKTLVFFIIISLASFILALGPALHLSPNTVHVGPIPAIPLPYAIFYYLLPGFSGFRTPSRWIILMYLALSVSIGLILQKRLSSLLTFILVAAILAEIQLPIKYENVPSVKNFPPEQHWLVKNYPSAAIIQLPIYNWSDQPGFGLETLREYYSTIHYHPMFNGFSGFSPRKWESSVFFLQKEFPSEKSLAFLKSLKIRLVLVPSSWENERMHLPQLRKIQAFPQTTVYELL